MNLWGSLLKSAPQDTAAPVPPKAIPDADLHARGLAVELIDVGKSFQGFWALRHVNLAVRRGECVGIIGYNGAGKSTLLQLVAGALTPNEGTVRTHGRIVPLLELGAGFNGDLSGRDNLYLSAALLGVTRATLDRCMTEIEAFAEIGAFIDKPVRTYSSGMLLRLAFSLLTQVEPDLMIIDEALTVGDAYFAHKCMRMIRRFREQGRSLLFVSHDAAAVKTFCDRALLLEKGHAVREGTPEEVLDYYNAMIAVRQQDAEILQTISSGRAVTRSGNGMAVISRFDLLGANNEPVRAVLCGSIATICCVVEFKERVEHPTVGFLIRDRLGNDVFGTNTFHLRATTGVFEPGEKLEVAFPVRLNLGGGHYSVTLAVHTGRDHMERSYDWCDNLLAFTVVPQWPFTFGGVAALEASTEISRTPSRLHRRVAWNQPLSFATAGEASQVQVSGWSLPEDSGCWTLGLESKMAVQLERASKGTLRATVVPFTHGNLISQRVELHCRGEKLSSWTLSGGAELKVALPATLVNSGDELEFTWLLPDATSPKAVGHSEDQRQLGLMFRSVEWRR